MAYDPEARRQSNSALIIAVVSALVLGGGLLAYLASRNNTPETGPTTVINANPRRETVVVNNNVSVPVPVVVATSAPSVIVREVPRTVVVPGTVVQGAPGTNTVTRIERNSTTVRDRVVAPRPAPGSAAPAPAGGTSSNTNVTVNVPPASSSSTTTSPTAGAMDSGAIPADNSASAPAAGNTAGGY